MFDEGSSTSAIDTSGSSYNGTPSNTTIATGYNNNTAMSFNGSNSYIQVNETSLKNNLQNGFTISSWIYPRAITMAHRIVDKSAAPSPASGFHLYVNTDHKIHFQINTSATVNSSDSIFPNSWYQVTVTIEANSKTQIYINGQKSGNSVTTGALSSITLDNFAIGNRLGATDRAFNGYIDDVRIYSSALSSSEIQKLYAEGKADHEIASNN
ncbi:MAG: LamG domain-containing protein [archaeon]